MTPLILFSQIRTVKLTLSTACLLLTAAIGCSKSSSTTSLPPSESVSTLLPDPPLVHSEEVTNPVYTPSDFRITVTDSALPVLRTAQAPHSHGTAIIYSMNWPAGVCSTQHHLEIGQPDSSHTVTVVSGVRIAFTTKYSQFVNGTVIDYGTRGSEAGLILTNPEMDLYAIVHSEADSILMTEMLGGGFEDYRSAVLRGDIILNPKQNSD